MNTLEWVGTDHHEIDKDNWSVRLRTNEGEIAGHYHPVDKASAKGAVIWVGGAGGGLDGPARGLYPAACHCLQAKQIAHQKGWGMAPMDGARIGDPQHACISQGA